MQSLLLLCSARGEAHLTMPVGLLPLVVSCPTASCSSLRVLEHILCQPRSAQPQPPVKHISGLCGCIVTEAIKASQATAHQELQYLPAAEHPALLELRAARASCPAPAPTPSHPSGLCCQPRAPQAPPCAALNTLCSKEACLGCCAIGLPPTR